MNNLVKQKKELLSEYMKDNADDTFETGYSDGFDAAINLGLSTKFAKWFESKEESYKNWARENHAFGRDNKIDEAYVYWKENIYKI